MLLASKYGFGKTPEKDSLPPRKSHNCLGIRNRVNTKREPMVFIYLCGQADGGLAQGQRHTVIGGKLA
jgi:hypothetical protein